MSFLQKLVRFFNQNKKLSIINIGSVVVVVTVSLYFFVLPLNTKNKDLRTTKSRDEQVLASQRTILSKKDALKSKVERLRAAIPDDPQLLKLGSNLQNLAVKNGIFVKTISFNSDPNSKATSKGSFTQDNETQIPQGGLIEEQGVTPSVAGMNAQSSGGNQKAVNVTMQLAGNNESFRRFLQSVETNLRLVDVTNMVLPKEGFVASSAYNIELQAYYWSN